MSMYVYSPCRYGCGRVSVSVRLGGDANRKYVCMHVHGCVYSSFKWIVKQIKDIGRF